MRACVRVGLATGNVKVLARVGTEYARRKTFLQNGSNDMSLPDMRAMGTVKESLAVSCEYHGIFPRDPIPESVCQNDTAKKKDGIFDGIMKIVWE